jgi:hypothetical protein
MAPSDEISSDDEVLNNILELDDKSSPASDLLKRRDDLLSRHQEKINTLVAKKQKHQDKARSSTDYDLIEQLTRKIESALNRLEDY